MPFQTYDWERLALQVRQLASLRYRGAIPIGPFLMYKDDGRLGCREPDTEEKPKKIKIGDTWHGCDKYVWLCAKVKIPPYWEGKTIAGLFDFGETDPGNTGKFEALLYVNGEPWQGVDANHEEVLFNAPAGSMLELRFRLWSGLTGGGKPYQLEHRLSKADLVVLHPVVDSLYYLAKNTLETSAVLETSSPDKTFLLNAVKHAFEQLDFSRPGSDQFLRSAEKARDTLLETLDGGRKMDVEVTMVGHTHIDVAWLWRYRHTREKCARSFSTALRLMERYGDFVQLQSMPQLYDFIRQDYPDIFDKIKQRVKDGLWEPDGAMWVESDCNLVSGESLVRQLLLGTRFFQQEFGYKSTFLWLPDSFGFSGAMPQILKQCGIETFATTKMSWNDTNRMPHDTFLWRGIDGSEILAHFVTTPCDRATLGEPADARHTYNAEATPAAVRGVWENYSSKDLNTGLLVAYGYGDGGGGVTRDMLENISCMERMPGLPHVKKGKAGAYFEHLRETVKKNPRGGALPVWDGDLYLEFHRGTYTSQARQKNFNRRLEYLARKAEAAAAVAWMADETDYPESEIREAWKCILRGQFHDVLPGSSIKEVYEDAEEDYIEAVRLLNGALDGSARAVVKEQEDCYTIWNPVNWSTQRIVFLPCGAHYSHFEDADGAILPARATPDGAEVLVNLPAFTQTAVYCCPGGAEVEPMEATAYRSNVTTPFYYIEWNEKGQLVKIRDRLAKRYLLKEGERGNVLQVFEDKPHCFDAWELESTLDCKMEEVCELADCTQQVGPLYTDVKFEWGYRNSKILQTMRLYEHSSRIDFITDVNWQEREKLMKVAFPLDIRATDARFDIQFGSIVRPTTQNTSWDAARFETVGHRWADVSETGYGVALLNDCKYGYDVKDSVLRLSLLKAAAYPDPDADKGWQHFTYALLPHSGEWDAGGLEEEAAALNDSPVVVPGEPLYPNLPMLAVEMENGATGEISVDALKKAEDSDALVLRLHERSGGRGMVQVELACGEAPRGYEWCECTPLEEQLGAWREGAPSFLVKPFELKSFLLRKRPTEEPKRRGRQLH